MASAKDEMKLVLNNQPDDSSYDEILRELAFKRMVDKGLDDITKGHVITNDQMRNKISSWVK